jgi:hypothetical protein
VTLLLFKSLSFLSSHLHRGHKEETTEIKKGLESKHRFESNEVKKILLNADESTFQGTLNSFIDLMADEEKIKLKAKQLKGIKDGSSTPSTPSTKRPAEQQLSEESPLKKSKHFTTMNDEEKVDFYNERIASQTTHQFNLNYLKEIVSLTDSLTWDILDGIIDYSTSDISNFSPFEFVTNEIEREEQRLKQSNLKKNFIQKLLPEYFDGRI